MNLAERLDRMDTEIHKPSFRQSTGRANEVNYWVFDYPPERELEVRDRIRGMVHRNQQGVDGFTLCVFDLYDMIIDYLIRRNFLEKCFDKEHKGGMEQIVRAVSRSLMIDDKQKSILVRLVEENTADNAVVFFTGIGKCYPLLRSHKVLNNLPPSFSHTPVVLFFPGIYTEQELILFNTIKDDNYYRAFRLVP